ncbi:hypothetical protein [Bacillus licheniformis]|uniref:hypothetical protein n=1 Tax=Bacillus licheniformis TaxID=1402 RepID=UPI00119E04E1|nr:hypothetical protein [Bacillus licheniformis]TWJ95210.1 hypothetical protein CHCC20495_0720 [Bacillus licheniformis]
MELKEAKEIIKAGCAWANWTDEQKEAMKLAIDCIDNQMKSENFKQVPYTIEIDWKGGVVWLNLPLSKEKIIVSEKESKSILRAFALLNAKKQGII